MGPLPHRQLAGFYFFYFAYIGAFAPFFSVYLAALGLSAAEIGVVMALPQVTRIVAPHLWGWLADAAGRPVRLVRVTAAAGALCWLGMFASTSFLAICAVVLGLGFFLSAALPLVEATTLSHLGEQTGRYGAVRLWGSIGYIVATRLFQLEFAPGIGLWLGGLVAGALVVGISGTLAVRSVINHSPVATLRGA